MHNAASSTSTSSDQPKQRVQHAECRWLGDPTRVVVMQQGNPERITSQKPGTDAAAATTGAATGLQQQAATCTPLMHPARRHGGQEPSAAVTQSRISCTGKGESHIHSHVPLTGTGCGPTAAARGRVRCHPDACIGNIGVGNDKKAVQCTTDGMEYQATPGLASGGINRLSAQLQAAAASKHSHQRHSR